jgi:hypothetical protein
MWRSIGENIAYMRGYDAPASSPFRNGWNRQLIARSVRREWKESACRCRDDGDGTYYLPEVFLFRK